jgi:diaminohydroxyphosphoribosylaminopyrimidine deaminase/5-amino-6-(5-phosphoribosylamino)uracil reductase
LTDSNYIKKTIQLARKGIGYASPNPMVGSVIVKNGKIVGQGYHHCFGKEHAEVVALRDAGVKARGATLYVNLEPCCHYGKTPPCTDAIIRAGIKKVVIGMVDPNPLVNQRGIETLKQHNIEVIAGVEDAACQELNRVFIKYITKGMPFVTLKIAQSIDGRIATKTGHSQWITSHQARVVAHRIRSKNDAIIVGIGTVLADNPQLTVRLVKGRNPVRVVLDSQLRIPLNSHLLTDNQVQKTIIATTSSDIDRIDQIKKTGVHVWEMESHNNSRIPIPALLKKLAQARMSAVMVEGGARIFTSFLKAKMVDHIVIAVAPKIIGSGIEAIGDLGILSVDNCIELINIKTKRVGPDFLVDADVRYSFKNEITELEK